MGIRAFSPKYAKYKIYTNSLQVTCQKSQQNGREPGGLESADGRREAHRVRRRAALVQSVEGGERGHREGGLRVRPLRDLLRQQRRAKVPPKDAHRRRRHQGDTRDGVRQVRQAARGLVRVVEGKSSKKERGVEQEEEGKGGAEQEQGEGRGRRLNSLSCRGGWRADRE